MKIIIFFLLPVFLFSSTLMKKYETGETFKFAEKDMLEEIKNHVNIPIIAVNLIKTEEEASYVIENNVADLVAIGRAQLPLKLFWVKEAFKNFTKRNSKKELEIDETELINSTHFGCVCEDKL